MKETLLERVEWSDEILQAIGEVYLKMGSEKGEHLADCIKRQIANTLEQAAEELQKMLSDDGKYGWRADKMHTDAGNHHMVQKSYGAREALTDAQKVLLGELDI